MINKYDRGKARLAPASSGWMTMLISVRLAEPYWRSVGSKELNLEVDEGLPVSELLAVLYLRYPSLRREIERAAPTVFVDDWEAGPDTGLTATCCVHLVWPVAGG